MNGTTNNYTGTYTIAFPRNNSNITLGSWVIPPMLLTSNVMFSLTTYNLTLGMAELVVMQSEVQQTLANAVNNNLTVTALHTHMLFENPKVYFIHMFAVGTTQDVANALYAVVQPLVNTTNNTNSSTLVNTISNNPPQNNSITPSIITNILGPGGVANNGTYTFKFPVATILLGYIELDDSMNVGNVAQFAGTDDNAIVMGFFAVYEGPELFTLLKSLNNSPLVVTAIVNHLIEEAPKMIFVHYVGQGTSQSLAQAINSSIISY